MIDPTNYLDREVIEWCKENDIPITKSFSEGLNIPSITIHIQAGSEEWLIFKLKFSHLFNWEE